MKLIFLLLMIIVINTKNATCQVTIAPTLGVTYMPFKFRTATTSSEHHKVNFLVGTYVRFPIQREWYIVTRMAYSKASPFKWTEVCLCPEYQFSTYKFSDISIDMNLSFLPHNGKLEIGLGPSVITRFYRWTDVDEDKTLTTLQRKILLGINSKLGVWIHRTFIGLCYTRKLGKSGVSYAPIGNNRVDITFAYLLLGSK